MDSSKQGRNRQDFKEEARYQEAAIYDDAKDHHQQDNAKEHHQEEDDANVHHQEEEEDDANVHHQDEEDAKDHHQEEDAAKDHHRQEDAHSDIERQETDNILEHAIEYLIEGAYPLGLTKDKKRAVRKKAQTISIEEGEVYIKRKKNKVGFAEN